ncbi:hypothetical protein AB0N23_13425 [Streptomyces sp. NPDC052644]
MNFRDALNTFLAQLTPQPWDYTTHDGTTLTVIPAGLPEDIGEAEVYIRITASKTLAAEAAITTTDLPALITALSEPVTGPWEHTAHYPDGIQRYSSYGLTLAPAADSGFVVTVSEDIDTGTVSAAVRLPERQRMPLASALRRALDVARDWESDRG